MPPSQDASATTKRARTSRAATVLGMDILSAESTTFVASRHRLVVGITLTAVLLLALALRLVNLDRLGFWVDEDLTWLAVTGILDHGWPTMPSGEPYLRGLPYSYVVSGFAAVLGVNELSLRLPSVLLSLGTVVMGFVFARLVAGARVGLFVAFLLAVSVWEIYYAQMARMYAALCLSYISTAYLFVRGFIRHEERFRPWAIVLAVVCVFIHRLGATLALVFLCPMLLPRRHRPPTRWMLAGAFAIAVTLVGLTLLAETRELMPIVREQTNQFLHVPLLPPIDLNSSRVLAVDALRENLALGSVLAVVLIAALLGTIWKMPKPLVGSTDPLQRVVAAAAGVTFCVTLLANQCVLASVSALIYLKLSSTDQENLIARAKLVIGCGVIVVAAILFTHMVLAGPGVVADRLFVRLFVSLPVPYYRALFWMYPATTLVAAGGALFAFWRGINRATTQEPLIVSLMILGPLLLMGLGAAPFYGRRYTYYLNGLFITYFVMTVAWAWRIIRARRARLHPTGWGAVVAFGVLCTVSFVELVDLPEAWAVTHRHYGYNRDIISHPDVGSSFHYDYAGCAAWIRENRQPGDVVMADRATESWIYHVQPDYRITDLDGVYARRPDGQIVDWYTGIPLLHTRMLLEEALAKHAGQTIWIIHTQEQPNGPHVPTPPGIPALLDEMKPVHVFDSRDGATRVLRFQPDAAAALAVRQAKADS